MDRKSLQIPEYLQPGVNKNVQRRSIRRDWIREATKATFHRSMVERALSSTPRGEAVSIRLGKAKVDDRFLLLQTGLGKGKDPGEVMVRTSGIFWVLEKNETQEKQSRKAIRKGK